MTVIQWTIEVRAIVDHEDDTEPMLFAERRRLDSYELGQVFHPEDTLPSAATIYHITMPMFDHVQNCIKEYQK